MVKYTYTESQTHGPVIEKHKDTHSTSPNTNPINLNSKQPGENFYNKRKMNNLSTYGFAFISQYTYKIGSQGKIWKITNRNSTRNYSKNSIRKLEMSLYT